MGTFVDVGLASVLSQASYVNHLEHQGTFAYIYICRYIAPAIPVIPAMWSFSSASLMVYCFLLACFSSTCRPQTWPMRAASSANFQSLTSASVLQRQSSWRASKPLMHTDAVFLTHNLSCWLQIWHDIMNLNLWLTLLLQEIWPGGWHLFIR